MTLPYLPLNIVEAIYGGDTQPLNIGREIGALHLDKVGLEGLYKVVEGFLVGGGTKPLYVIRQPSEQVFGSTPRGRACIHRDRGKRYGSGIGGVKGVFIGAHGEAVSWPAGLNPEFYGASGGYGAAVFGGIGRLRGELQEPHYKRVFSAGGGLSELSLGGGGAGGSEAWGVSGS
jgi:hypothetical protein